MNGVRLQLYLDRLEAYPTFQLEQQFLERFFLSVVDSNQWTSSGTGGELGSGMSSFVNLLETRRADVRVDLGGDQTSVAQQFLHASNVGASIKQMSREAMPQCMRTGSQVQPRCQQILFQHSRDTASRQSCPEFVDEHR